MSYYYIINNKIVEYENEFDSNLYSYQQLSNEQVEFYLNHQGLSISNILNLEEIIDNFSLELYKEQMINMVSGQCFQERSKYVPDYKLTNALYDIYGEDVKLLYINIINQYRDFFYQKQSDILLSADKGSVDNIINNLVYPVVD